MTDDHSSVEAVAVIGKDWALQWASPDTLTEIVNRTGIKIGSRLYAAMPTPSDQDKLVRHDERKKIIAGGCIHTRKAGENADYDRPDVSAWQHAQGEYFDPTICEIVSEYAAWRDQQAIDQDKLVGELVEGSAAPETWASINQWCDNTFGPATVEQIIKRAKEEFDELEVPGADHAVEAADVTICLCRIPGFADALQAKMKVNRARKWRLVGNGTGYHIPDNGSAEQ